MKTWTNKHHPKTSGPWDGEPDKAQWIDEATGFDCLMVRNQFGALCGYVGLPPDHPLHGQDYNDVDAHVHGGLTFAGPCMEGAPEDQGVCHVPEAGRPDKVWWLGFDCAHAGDWAPDLSRYGNDTYRTFDYVQHQCAVLAGQLAAHSSDYDVPPPTPNDCVCDCLEAGQ